MSRNEQRPFFEAVYMEQDSPWFGHVGGDMLKKFEQRLMGLCNDVGLKLEVELLCSDVNSMVWKITLKSGAASTIAEVNFTADDSRINKPAEIKVVVGDNAPDSLKALLAEAVEADAKLAGVNFEMVRHCFWPDEV